MRVSLQASLLVLSTAAVIACDSRQSDKPAAEPAKSVLPTRQTTIDPVTKKLDTAREDAERRRQQVDDAYK